MVSKCFFLTLQSPHLGVANILLVLGEQNAQIKVTEKAP